MYTKSTSELPVTCSALHTIEIDPQTDPRWQSFLDSLPASWIYYSPAWLQVLEEAYDYKPAHLACVDAAGQVVGILPLFHFHGRRSGQILKSIYSGPMARDDAAGAVLLQGAVERVRAETGAHLRLKILSNALDDRVESMVGMPSYWVYLLSLPERFDQLRLDPSIKRAVKKAARSGIEVRQAENERDLRAWYEMYLHTMQKLVVFPNPYRFYQVAWRLLHGTGMLRLLLAEQVEAGKRRLLAGNIMLQYGNTISFDASGWREGDQSLRPNDLLHWTAIEEACAAGVRWYDWGDVSFKNPGLARYKSKWGAVPQIAYAYNYPILHQQMSASNDQSSNDQSGSTVRRLMLSTWHHLPATTFGVLSHWYYALHLY